MKEEDYKHYEHVLNTNKKGMDPINRDIYLKMFGFACYDDLLMHMTVAGKMKNIKVPTFGLSAKDDNVCGDQFLPKKEVMESDNSVCLAVTNYGSHACHIGGWLYPKCWYPYPCMEFIEFLEKRAKKE